MRLLNGLRKRLASAPALTLGVFGLIVASYPASAEVRGADYFSNLPLVTQDGETVRFWDDLLRDRIVVVSFAYVDCPDLCSLSTARLAQIYDWLGDRMGRDIFFYTITLDPENDTPADLKEFADAFGVGRGWTFLTGRPEDIDVIRYKLGERSRTLAEHRSDMVIGNARTGVWRRSSVMGSLAVALQSILELDPERSAFQPVNPASALTVAKPYDLAGHPGEAIFLKVCASCHTIGNGVKHAPDLAAVTVRRNPDWLRRFLQAPDAMLASGDPIAVALNSDYPGIQMPNLGLGEADVADLMAYLSAADQRVMDEYDAGAEVGETEHHHNSGDGFGKSLHRHFPESD